ncbi:MAG: hypothetical protein HY903_13440 [Deltaproteobacteria bacterium]|nr:hypothetical protein [Deltaproteobacteria bacterium]
MLCWLVSTLLSTAVPTPGAALLQIGTADDLTRMLLAGTVDQKEEEENLERDMDRARDRLGHKGAKDGEVPAASQGTTETDDSTEDTRDDRRRRRHRGPRVQRFRALSDDGHGKAYYLAWGIVDWAIAADLWVAAAWFTVVGMAALANANNGYCRDGYGRTRSCDADRAGGTVLLGLGVLAGAGGGVAAWRGGTNIGTFKDLRAQERAHREAN